MKMLLFGVKNKRMWEMEISMINLKILIIKYNIN
jgi:hypothetical protein